MKVKEIFFLLLLTAPHVLFSQRDFDCDSAHVYFENMLNNKVGLIVYDKPPIPGKDQLPVYISDTDFLKPGKIFIRFIIGKNGELLCARVIKSENEKLNERALKLAQSVRFTPAEQKGKAVVSTVVLPIVFGERKPAVKKRK